MADNKSAEEIAQAAADAALKDPPTPDQVWIYPFDLPPPPPAQGGSRFAIRRHPMTHEPQFHNGVDWAMIEGTPLLAVAKGKVESVLQPSQSHGGGLSVVLQFSDGYRATYCHMSAVHVTAGQAVQPREVLGLSGGRANDPNAGLSTAPHLHFGVSYKGPWTDPEQVYKLCLGSLKYVCPLDVAGMPPNLWKHYANNEGAENGVGGYFAIGLRRNFHGGVHLFPAETPADGTPVRALAAGYIVAARLPGTGSKGLDPAALKNIGSWPGFVIVRHQLREVKPDPNAACRSGYFYSLYMHLKPPKLSASPPASGGAPAALTAIDTSDPYFKNVPWFRSLAERRFGAFVNVLQELPADKKAIPPAPGRMAWAAEEVVKDQNGKPTKSKYKVLGDLKEIEVEVAAPSGAAAHGAPPASAPGTLRWLHKPSPVNIQKVTGALASGLVVTFGEPVLPVSAGETLGFIAPCPQAMGGTPTRLSCDLKNAAGVAVPTIVTMESGFLHWQVFASASDPRPNGIELLLELAQNIAQGVSSDPSLPTPTAPTLVKIADDGDDNFIELEEMTGKLTPALPEKDRQGFEAAFKDLPNTPGNADRYARSIVEMLDSSTSFSPRPDRVDWETGCKFKVPVLLQLEEQLLMPPDQNSLANGKYALQFEFERAVGEAGGAGARAPLVCDGRCDRAACTGEAGSGAGKPCKPKPFEIDASLYNSRRDARKRLVTFTLMVPAKADRMRVNLSGGIVGMAGAPVKGAELMLLSDAVKERWRNTKIRHINEWSIQSITKVLEKLKAHFNIAPEAREVAWCDPDKEAAVGRVVLEAAPSGIRERAERAVRAHFAPDSGALLPYDGKIDDLHPVTATWLLNLLDKQKKALVVDTWKAEAFGKEDAAPLAVGWVADVRHPKPLVGGYVYAVAVDDDYGYDTSLKVKILAKGPMTLELALTRYESAGVAVLPVDICFWGDWTIETEPAAKKDNLFGATKLSIPALEFDTFSQAETDLNVIGKTGDAGLSWIVKVKRPVRAVYGVVSMQTRRPGEAWPSQAAREAVMVPATAVASLPVVEGEGEAVPKEADLFVQKDGFILGLDPAKKKTDAKVSEGLAFSEYKKAATDFKIAFSLLEALLAVRKKTDKLTVESIALDGLSLRVRPQNAKAQVNAASTILTLLGVAVEIAKSMPGLMVLPENDALGHVKLAFNLSTAAHVEACSILKDKSKALVPDASGLFVLDVKESLIASFPVSELRSAYQASNPFRLSLALAKALHCLRQQLKSISLTYLSLDGMSCRVSNSVEQAKDLAKQSGLFLVVEIENKELCLTVNPEPERFLALKFDPAPMLRNLMMRDDLPSGAQLQYRFLFETVNGLHYLWKRSEGGWPLDMKELASKHFDELVKRGGRRLTFGPSVPASKMFSKLAFKESTLTWTTKKGVPCIVVESEVIGELEYWKSFRIKITRTGGSGGMVDVKGAGALPPPAGPSVAISFPIPVIDNDKAFQGELVVRIEAVAIVAGATPPLPVQAAFNCRPRWETSQLTIDGSSPTEIKVSCRAIAMEVPEMTNGHATPAKTTREFVLKLVELQSPPAPPDPPQVPVPGYRAAPTPRRPRPLPTVLYANTSERGFGYLDGDGIFVARIPRVPSRGSIHLADGAVYKLSLERPNQSKVRGLLPEPEAPSAIFPIKE